MSLFLFDTDHFSLYQLGHPKVLQNVVLHASDQLAISVITVEESLGGWQTALRQAKDDARREQVYQRMAQTARSFGNWSILPFSRAGMSKHASLLRQGVNIGSNDIKIAMIALENNACVVTRNLRDFGRVPGLPCVDWTV